MNECNLLTSTFAGLLKSGISKESLFLMFSNSPKSSVLLAAVAVFFFGNFMLHLNVYYMYKTRTILCVLVYLTHHTAVMRMAVSTTTMAAQPTPTGTATVNTNWSMVTTWGVEITVGLSSSVEVTGELARDSEYGSTMLIKPASW